MKINIFNIERDLSYQSLRYLDLRPTLGFQKP